MHPVVAVVARPLWIVATALSPGTTSPQVVPPSKLPVMEATPEPPASSLAESVDLAHPGCARGRRCPEAVVTGAVRSAPGGAAPPTPAVKVIEAPAAGMLRTTTLLAVPSYLLEFGLLVSVNVLPLV